MTGGRDRTDVASVRPRRRLVAFGAALAVLGSAATLGIASGDPAGAAPTPKPDYTAGKDTATFTLSGIRDSNCYVSVGGNQVFIKPGDKINFKSELVGLNVAGLNLSSGTVTGLNVTATIDAGKSSEKKFSVPATETTAIDNLSSGTHTLAWTASSVAVSVPVLSVLGQLTGHKNITVPLSSSALQSGAKLSWTGKVYVTKDAPKCKLGVSTPQVDASAGPVKVKVPQQNVNVPGVTLPNDLPSVGDLAPKLPTKTKTSGTSKTKTTTSAPRGSAYQLPGESVPEQVVPGGTSGNVSYSGGGGSYTGSGNYAGILPKAGNALGTKSGSGTKDSGASDTTSAGGSDKTVELASQTGSPSSQLPVILAVLAIVALAAVGGTYAKLFLLKQSK